MRSVIVIVAEGGRVETRDRHRAENYLHAMRQWIRQETDTEYEVITVEQNTGAKQGRFEFFANILAEESKVPFSYQVIFGDVFRRGWAMNVGAKMACGDELIFADADALVGRGFMATFDERLSGKGYKAAVPWRTFYRLTETGRERCIESLLKAERRLFEDELGQDDILQKVDAPTTGGAAGGINYYDRDFFFNELGGWNETFSLGAGGDNDMLLRAADLLGGFKDMPSTLFHLWHPGKAPGEDSQELWSFTQKHPQLVTDEIKRLGIGGHRPAVYSMAELSERYRLGG